jgi:hypothetical protein
MSCHRRRVCLPNPPARTGLSGSVGHAADLVRQGWGVGGGSTCQHRGTPQSALGKAGYCCQPCRRGAVGDSWPGRAGVEFQRRPTCEEQGGQHVEGKSAPRRLTRWDHRIQLSTHQQRLLYLAPANNAGPTKPTACRSPSRPWAKYLVVPNAKMLPYLDRRPLCFSLLSSVAQPEHGQT